jgi:hypothetical protein
MCPQVVGLVQKYSEELGIMCSVISIIDEITNQLKIPRYYSVPYQLGYPLGPSNDFNNQKLICKNALELIYQ